MINREIDPFDPLIEKDGGTPASYYMEEVSGPRCAPTPRSAAKFMGYRFRTRRHCFSTIPAAFKEAGLDPLPSAARPGPSWIGAAKALNQGLAGGETQRWGLMFPATYD